jgi:aryl-alcohol dehydrogenase-like predicted oxidoreductase
MNTSALDEYVTLGRSGLRVSPFCLGTMTFGQELGWGATEEDSEAILAALVRSSRFRWKYSLLERTVEGELIPAAQELGLGVMPWSPLKNGALSGKYTRENAGKQKADRGAIVEKALGDKAYAIVDELVRIGKEVGATPAGVALAWVRGRPGVTSTIVGARNIKQLDQNLDALSVTLTAAQAQRLDALSNPELGFTASVRNFAPSFMHGGLTVNGELPPPSPYTRKADSPQF